LRPGQFKEQANRAGGSHFVLPEHIEGTLRRSFEIYRSVTPGLKRAIFMQFLISECHLFDDGNGRLARVMMNAELVINDLHKAIVPPVHRESYLRALRAGTRQNSFRAIVKVFSDLQAYTASLKWSEYAEVRETLEAHYADKLPDEGVPTFNKQIAPFKLELPVG